MSESVETQELPVAPENYWDGFDSDDMHFAVDSIPKQAAELPKRPGQFSFWRSDIRLLRKLEIIYENAAGTGLRVVTNGGD
ncbi:MAG: hypothetical protein ACOC0A_04115 [Planctomycetota bacterium]